MFFMINISDHITFMEATFSATALRYGIRNTPSLQQVTIMRHLGINLFEPLRAALGGRPINITSFYRSPTLNRRIGGASKSDHMILEDTCAIDLDNDIYPPYAAANNASIFWHIYDNLPYNKLIWEFGDKKNPAWVHISFSLDDRKNLEKKTLHAKRKNGRTTYELFNPTDFYR